MIHQPDSKPSRRQQLVGVVDEYCLAELVAARQAR